MNENRGDVVRVERKPLFGAQQCSILDCLMSTGQRRIGLNLNHCINVPASGDGGAVR
jgi:hypothetical protein